jgi:hypothetical protein
MPKWSMKEDRQFIKLAAAKLSVDRIASKMGCSPLTIFKAARRLGVNLGPRPAKLDRRVRKSG